jgi:hypothetical protein
MNRPKKIIEEEEFDMKVAKTGEISEPTDASGLEIQAKLLLFLKWHLPTFIFLFIP